MGISVIPAPAGGGKTRKIEMLTSGSSWTVPAGVDYVVATLQGAGGGGAGKSSLASNFHGTMGHAGQRITTTVNTTPGASISYAIGAGGTGNIGNGSAGGNTTFTGATTANGGNGGSHAPNAGTVGTSAAGFFNGGGGSGSNNITTSLAGGDGGNGYIELEYWV
jgi:hypothetical protein